MFNGLLVNASTKKHLDQYLAKPGQALLLEGPSGAGKFSLAGAVAAKHLGKDTAKLKDHAYFIHIEKPIDKSEILIEQIRELKQKLNLQVPGHEPVRRVVIIENAHLMNTEAQNAFLKSLEEPPQGTVFILTAEASAGLLPTITSRTVKVAVKPISLDLATGFYDVKKDEVAAAWALSQGYPGLLNSLLSDEDSQLKKAVADAKNFLSKTPYERLIILDQIKDKTELYLLLDGLGRVVKALYRAAASKNDDARTARLTKSFKEIADAQNGLRMNVLPRLVILRLVTSLSI